MYYFPPIMTGIPGTNLLPPNVTGLTYNFSSLVKFLTGILVSLLTLTGLTD